MNDFKVDWKRKLTSRKFWAAIVGFVTPLILTFGVDERIATQVTSIIMSGGALIAYIIGEGFTDAASAKSSKTSNTNSNDVNNSTTNNYYTNEESSTQIGF